MSMTPQVPELVSQKLAAFDALQTDFENCFRFKQAVHGQKRFSSFSLADTVYYLHSLWLCECKDGLLSIYKNIPRYEGRHCLKLLRWWQRGQNAGVIDFLTSSLHMLSFAELITQLEVARRDSSDEMLIHRLEHGRFVLLKRGLNLLLALESIFSVTQERLQAEVCQACEQYGHTPDQIESQLRDLETSLYAYRPHQLLARRNMVVMNKLNIEVLDRPADLPGERSSWIKPPTAPPVPFAELAIDGYLQLSAPMYNNLRQVRFIDRVEFDKEAEKPGSALPAR